MERENVEKMHCRPSCKKEEREKFYGLIFYVFYNLTFELVIQFSSVVSDSL